MQRKLKVESLPSDIHGCKLENVRGVPGKVQHVNEDGTIERVDGMVVQADMDVKIIEFRDPKMNGKTVELCSGAKFTLNLIDIMGQICPDLLCLGEVVVAKGKEYKLVYEDIPIEGWTIRDRSDTKNPNAKQTCYPEGIKTQKDLMELLISHEAIHLCPFANWRIEYPAEVQERMDMDALEVREKALEERKAAIKKEFERQESLLATQRAEIAKKKKGNAQGEE